MSDQTPRAASPARKTTAAAQSRGGPRTAAGKAVSRGNALKHGNTATTLLPQVLQPGRVAAIRQDLEQDFPARSTVERLQLDELARHAARLEYAEQAEEAVLREGAREAARRAAEAGALHPPEADTLLAAAAITPAVELVSRYRRGHERGFDSALRAFANQRAATDDPAPMEAAKGLDEPRFPTEAASEAQVRQRFGAAAWQCPRCSATKGHWLVTRKCWECGQCKKQVSLRAGTVMHSSPLPLATWCYAIQLIIQHPEISADALGQRIAIDRDKTVRTMAAKIRAALADETARLQLAGLDKFFEGAGRT